jgi:hypothetical protein
LRDDNPRKATEQLLDGPGQPAGAVLRAALRDFIEPESAGGDDETVATFGSTTWMLGFGNCLSTSKARTRGS